jgi:hypothetical protein
MVKLFPILCVLCVLCVLLTIPLCSALDTSDFLAGLTQTGSSEKTSPPTIQEGGSFPFVTASETDPAAFYPYEDGTVTVRVKNPVPVPIGISNIDLIESHLQVKKPDAFKTVTYIGPGVTTEFVFNVRAIPPVGTYSALFTAETTAGAILHCPVKVIVDDQDLRISAPMLPESFARDMNTHLNLTITNPRPGVIRDITIIPSGPETFASPKEVYIPSISAESSVDTRIHLLPRNESEIVLGLQYYNGNNPHRAAVRIPVHIGEGMLAVSPVISNTAITSNGEKYWLTGDLTNTGMADAHVVSITTKDPANRILPNPVSSLGTLAPDDISSFTLTFSTKNPANVPVLVSWKDGEGRLFSKVIELDLRDESGFPVDSAGSPKKGPTGDGSGIFVFAVGAVIGIAGYAKRQLVQNLFRRR